MGWGSASEIFDPVAQGLVDANASDEIKTRVLTGLIGKLLAEDWDTWDYSLEAFKDDKAIVAAFAEHGITLHADEEDDG